MPRKIVIIGGSAAGPKAASKARRMDQEADITIIQKGKYLSMASCGYPYFIGGVFDDRNMLISTPTGVTRDPSFFSKVKAINALISTEVIEIDREGKKVSAKNMETGESRDVPYDKLIIATGSTPIVPGLPGKDLDGISTLQSMEDADFLKKVAVEKKIKNAVIVGGGLIGIETCEALQLAEMNLTIVEMQNQILPFLDWEMAKLVENYMVSRGANIITEKAVTEFVGKDGKVTGVKLSDGSTIDCELAVLSIGVRPNTALARKAGLNIGCTTGGISVNRFLQTSDPDIYAAGDCIEVTNLVTHNKQVWPMGDAANLQGRVAGQNVVLGNTVEYEGMVGTGICKIFDYNAGCTGLSEKMAKDEGYRNILTAIHAAPDKPGFMGAKPMVIKVIAEVMEGGLIAWPFKREK